MAWDLTLTVVVYLGFAFAMIVQSNGETRHRRAALYNESDWMIVAITVGSAAATFRSAHATPWPSLFAAAAIVILSWTFTHTVFALHHANIHYRPDELDSSGGPKVPGERASDYRDFLYYAFVIG